ncbi:hypothetical protein [Leptospira brenneri]|nr:hypothetical protein [Leptospira brenneri]
MSKSLIPFFILKIFSLVVVCFLGLSCLGKDAKSKDGWMVSLLGLALPIAEDEEIPNERNSHPTNDYLVHSVSPSVVLENSSFFIEGKNLKAVTEKQLFGEGFSKFLNFSEVTDSKITVSLQLCPDSSLVFPGSGDKEKSHQISIPCLGSFRYSVRSPKFDLGMTITPFAPNISAQVLEVLGTLGELEFVLESNLPLGMQMNSKTGEILGTPTETTGNEFRSYNIIAQVKSNPNFRIKSQVRMIVVSEEEKMNRTCRSIAETSTCRGPSPHVCSNSSICYTSQFACEMDSKCGFIE